MNPGVGEHPHESIRGVLFGLKSVIGQVWVGMNKKSLQTACPFTKNNYNTPHSYERKAFHGKIDNLETGSLRSVSYWSVLGVKGDCYHAHNHRA